MSGGAIYIVGTGEYHVIHSMFFENTVVPAPWATTAAFALRIFTGAQGTLSNTGAMWSMDDGPVFGLPATASPDVWIAENSYAKKSIDCGSVRQASLLRSSWPGDAPCANNTAYQPSEMYTHSLELIEGPQ